MAALLPHAVPMLHRMSCSSVAMPVPIFRWGSACVFAGGAVTAVPQYALHLQPVAVVRLGQ